MAMFKETGLAPRFNRDPFAMIRQMRSDFERMFEEPFFRKTLPCPSFDGDDAGWTPKIEVFERENRLVTKVELPGMKKDDVKVEVTHGHLAIYGERKREFEEKKENVFRSEREYGTFYRSVLLPEGVKLEDVKATFADGVLEVSVPMPAKIEPKMRNVEIEENKGAKTAA
jgi:HSP20 family protein